MRRKLYLRTTKDKYELPVAVAESLSELSRMTGHTKNVISSAISKKQRGWYRIEVNENDEEG